jgi:uncharacterized membrane protein YbhN (UPF0104 family)
MVRMVSPCERGRVSFSTNLSWQGGGVRELTREIAPSASSYRARRPLALLMSISAGTVLTLLIALHGDEFVRAIDRALHASWKLVGVGAALEAASIGGYVLLLHRVVAAASPRLRLKDSYDITLAGTATTRLLPTAGLGGAAVTVWALRARGVRANELAERLLAFLLLLYGVYMAALVGFGGAVAIGVVRVSQGRALGVAGAALGLAVAGAVLGLLSAPSLTRGLLRRAARGPSRFASAAGRAEEQLPVLRGALRCGWRELRRPHPALLGALGWWGFDIAVLVAMLQAFGTALPIPVIVLAYFLGTTFNVLPLPGSLSGGLTGALIALGAPAGAAIAAVLAYRAVAVWLPAASGIASLANLRRSVASWRAETDAGTGYALPSRA